MPWADIPEMAADTAAEVVEYVKARRANGVKAASYAKAAGLSERDAKARLYRASRALPGTICCLMRAAGSTWVAVEYAESCLATLKLRSVERRRKMHAARERLRKASMQRQRVVSAAKAKPIVTTAPRSVFDLGRMVA